MNKNFRFSTFNFQLKKLPFLLLGLLVTVMAIATFVEKSKGTDFAYQYIYGSWWFTFLWAILSGLSIVMILKRKLHKNIPLCLLHLSFVVILIGAFFTKISSVNGYVVLEKNQACQSLQTQKEGITHLPFEICLDSFYVAFYPGTDSPADYVSHIHIKDEKANVNGVVSMNHIFSYRGYRFYQTSFEDDFQTSVLSVNRDVWGIPITYSGYALFMLSGLLCLLAPKGNFRRLISHPLLKKVSVILLFLAPLTLFANTLTKDSLTTNREQAKAFGNLWMLNNGRITSVAVFAHDFTLKLTGKPSFKYLDANQFLMGFLFFPEKWQQVALFEIEDPILKKELNATTEKAALVDFYNADGTYKLAKYRNPNSKSAQQKEVEKLNEKVQLINMLHNGNLLQIYPQKVSGQLRWLTPTQTLSSTIADSNVWFIRYSLLEYYQALKKNNHPKALEILNSIKDFQTANAKEVLPSEFHQKAELFYLKANITSWLFKINLTIGILCLLSIFVPKIQKLKILNRLFRTILLLSFLALTLSIVLRTYLSGYLPLSNGYETMMIIAWCAMLVSLIFARKVTEILPFGFLLSGCSLLVAHLGMMNPEITPLVPVLSSPLLSIHVSLIMLSYTLLGFIALNSIISIAQILFSKDKQKILLLLERNKIYSTICLYPALFLLGAGIFVGAIWANISWGRYWGWDPKEVWALITFLIYSFALHEKIIKPFKNIFFFHTFGIIAFLSVLMTYFGVNFFLGGMHSYAGEIHFGSTTLILVLSFVLLTAFLIAGYVKFKRIISSS